MSLTNSYNILLSLQCNFNKYICDHLYSKWVTSQGNILNFMTRLDDVNREKLLRYVQFGEVVNIST